MSLPPAATPSPTPGPVLSPFPKPFFIQDHIDDKESTRGSWLLPQEPQ